MFLNHDVEALQPGWLEAMAAQALRPAVGAVGALLLSSTGRMVAWWWASMATPSMAIEGCRSNMECIAAAANFLVVGMR